MNASFQYGFEKLAYATDTAVGAALGSALGGATGDSGKRKKRALIGAGIGGAVGAGLKYHHMKGIEDIANKAKSGEMNLEQFKGSLSKHIGGAVQRADTGLAGAGIGAVIGALGHKIVGGKKENRAKAGKIGAGIGGVAGLLAHGPIVRALYPKTFA